MKNSIEKIILVKPRGFCAGVRRAVETVEEAVKIFGKPVYIKHEIVHNKTVVKDLEKKGVITVEDLSEIPKGSIVVFSAHGSTPEQYKQAQERNLKTIDATCPLVTKVHLEVHRLIKKGYDLVYIGHKNHIEGIGVRAESLEYKKEIPVVETVKDIKNLELEGEKLAYLTQTTLSISQTEEIVEELKKKFPQIIDPPTEDICYATTNRQKAVLELAKQADIILVVGSKESSNSNQLVARAKELGVDSYLIDGLENIKEKWFVGKKKLGITAGASAPEFKVLEIAKYFKDAEVEELLVVDEKMKFKNPKVK